jgi:peptidoglycan hydrolase CwlO-like protein
LSESSKFCTFTIFDFHKTKNNTKQGEKPMKLSKMLAVVGLSTLFFAGCCSVSDEEYAALDALQNSVNQKHSTISQLNGKKADINKQIADKQKKLEECNQLKNEVNKNLNKINK